MPIPIGSAIALAIQLMPIIEKGIVFIRGTMNRARASGELTPEQEALYQKHQAAILASPQAQIEPDPT